MAKEVSNLADVSGTAAREIDSLLAESESKVKDTLELIASRVVEAGSVSEHVKKAFTGISSNIVAINNQMKSISDATQHQESSIQQTNAAMKEMESAAQENNNASANTNTSAAELKTQSEQLAISTSKLWIFVNGNRQGKNSAAPNPTHAPLSTEPEAKVA